MANETISREELEKEIADFLESTCCQTDRTPGPHRCGLLHRNALVLATSYQDEPRATPLEFFHEGFTLYIFGEPGGKIANIKRNPRVCAAIYEQPLDHRKSQRSLQIWGTARLIHCRNDKKTFLEKVEKWNIRAVAAALMSPQLEGLSSEERLPRVEKFLEAINLICLEPQRMVLRKYHADFSMPKYQWEKGTLGSTPVTGR